MYWKKKLYVFVAMLLVISIMLAGCGGSTSSGSKNPTDNGASGTSSKSVTITWWSHNNPDFVEANKKLIGDFNKVYPNIKINYQYFPYETMNAKLKASYAAHSESDIQQMFGTWATYYASHNWLSPVPVDAAQMENDFFEAPLGAYKYNDKYYGIPHEYNIENGGVLAHPKMFQEENVPYPPKTWDELVAAAQKLTKTDSNGNITRFGFDFASLDNITFLFLSLILQQGGQYWDKDGVHVVFTTPEADKAMQTMADLILKYKVTDLKHLNQPNELDISDNFFRGQSAMTMRGPWTIATGLNTYKVKDFDYIPMPSFTDKPPYFAAESGWGEVVSANSKHTEEAWKFAEFITSKESSLYFNVRTFTVPARKDVAKDPEFVKQIPLMKTSLDVLEYGQWIGPLQDTDQFKNILCTHFQNVVEGKEQVSQALQNIQNEVNKMIDQQLK